MNKLFHIAVLLFFLSPLEIFAQDDTLRVEPEIQDDILEDLLQDAGEEASFDYNTLFEELEGYLEHPLDLNKATEAELRDLNLLSDRQIGEFLRYRSKLGALIATYELQAIPGFDLETIRRLLPFVKVAGSVYDVQLPIAEMLLKGKNEVYLRWSRILEEQKGYTEAPNRESRYIGDPNQLYLRYKHSYDSKLSYGFTAEKDRGEAFFTENNKKGFDFYSAHFYLKEYNHRVKAVAIGDYTISFGQGLILFSGFSYGKSSQTANIKRTGRAIRPYTAVGEWDFMRGAATTLGLSKNLTFTTFASYRNRFGRVVEPDSLDSDQEIRYLTSLDQSGLHRTQSEISKENAVKQFTTGGSLKYQKGGAHIALNTLYNKLNAPLFRNPKPYNEYYFKGDQLANVSLDYAFMLRNFHFFGETAMSDNGSIASLNGLIIGLDQKVDFAILHRYFPKDYQALNANPFAETSGARNETGLYVGLEVRPKKGWKVNAYFDQWRHPYLRYRVDAPSRGHEYRFRVTHYRKRTYEAFIEIRNELKERNADVESSIKPIRPHRLFQTRVHLSNKVNKALELRSRVDFGVAEDGSGKKLNGIVLFQDVIFKPMSFPLSFTTRFAIFDTDGYDIRYYSYENSLLYTFSIPAYYNKGTRFYLNLRYKGIRNVTLEARFAQTYWSNQDSFGSGLEEIQGKTRTQVSAQMKIKF